MISYILLLINLPIFRKFKIKKGNHSSGFRFWFTFGSHLSYKCKLDSSSLYTINGVDKYDVNKLFGLSTSFSHHTNSARIGWTSLEANTIELYAYVYDNKKRLIEKITNVDVNKEFKCSIKVKKGVFTFEVVQEDKLSIINLLVENKHLSFKYFLYPYFGGNISAPHDIYIYLKRV